MKEIILISLLFIYNTSQGQAIDTNYIQMAGDGMWRGSIEIDRFEGNHYTIWDAKPVQQTGWFHTTRYEPDGGNTYHYEDAIFYNGNMIVKTDWYRHYKKVVKGKYVEYETIDENERTYVDTAYLKHLILRP